MYIVSRPETRSRDMIVIFVSSPKTRSVKIPKPSNFVIKLCANIKFLFRVSAEHSKFLNIKIETSKSPNII